MNKSWLGYIGDYTTQLSRDYYIYIYIYNHFKDLFQTTSIPWNVSGRAFCGSCELQVQEK